MSNILGNETIRVDRKAFNDLKTCFIFALDENQELKKKIEEIEKVEDIDIDLSGFNELLNGQTMRDYEDVTESEDLSNEPTIIGSLEEAQEITEHKD